MSKPLQKAELKQESIVLAAETLFLQQGYSVTSMDNIAQKAQVTKQTIYRYFSSKQTLFEAVIESNREKRNAVHTFTSGTVLEEITGYGEYILSFHLQASSIGLYRLMLMEGSNENLMKSFIKNGPKQVTQPLVEFLKNHFPELQEPEFTAQIFISMVLVPRNQQLMNSKTRITKVKQKEHVGKVVRLFLKMIDE